MTVTMGVTATENRWGTSRTWSLHTTSVTVGTLQTAAFSFALWRWNGSAWALLDTSYAGPVFGHIFDIIADNGVQFKLDVEVLEQGASEPTTYSTTWTHACIQPDVIRYVSSFGTDDGSAGRGETEGDPYQTMDYACAAVLAAMGSGDSGMVLAKASETHDVSTNIWSYEGVGRICVDRFGGGADPIMNLTANVTPFNGVGQYSATNNCSLDWRNFTVTGSPTHTVPLVEVVASGGASPMLNQSHVMVNIVASQTGTLTSLGVFPALSETERSNGALDHFAIRGCSLSSPATGAYGVYGGYRYFLLDDISVSGLSTARSGLRSYDSQFVFGRNFTCFSGEGDAFRLLSTTLTADLQSRWHSIDGWASYDVPYLFHNTDNEGGDTTINKFWDQWFVNCRSNPRISGGIAFAMDGDRKRIVIRSPWLRGCGIAFGRVNADNDEAVDMFVECATVYVPSFGGGDGLFVNANQLSAVDVVSSWRIRNNFVYLASGSGTGFFCEFSLASGALTTSTVLAAAGDSDYNVWLAPTGSINWYRGLSGGNTTSLATWQGSGRDLNSAVLTAGAHGLTALGTTNADDYDFHISTSSVARNAGVAVPGARTDHNNKVRQSAHDAGANDADGTDPVPPGTGGGGGGGPTPQPQAPAPSRRRRQRFRRRLKELRERGESLPDRPYW